MRENMRGIIADDPNPYYLYSNSNKNIKKKKR
jgi:hypothetical protein